MIEEINTTSIETEMKRSYLEYAMSVIIGRALPDVRDGLKPVHRRVLFAMRQLRNDWNKSYKKSARVVGDVIGKYHPHGDSAVYDTIVRMAQDFSLRYTLVDGQGNFGCFIGETKIKLVDGTEKSFAELAKLPENEIFYVYSVDKTGKVVVGEGRHARITYKNAELIELILDNGEQIQCTPDHRFMLRDGTYKEARSLTFEDSLMPGYFDSVPDMMQELSKKSKIALHNKWSNPDYKIHIIRQKILGYVQTLIQRFPEQEITPELYEAERKPNGVPKYQNTLQYFSSFKELLEAGHNYNHKIVAKNIIEKRAEVYDITVDEHHNFLLSSGVFVHNSVDGDSPAAMRYTEIRMKKIAHLMLVDLEKETVDFNLNYDETMEEPSVLPTKFPALIVNGSSGIAVGMTTNIPPHNIGEVVDGLTALLENPEIEIPELMLHIPGPDFPTYGIVNGKKGIYDAYTTGRGIITLRAVVEVEENSRNNSETIVVTELPYQVNKAKLVEKTAALVREKVIEGVSYVRDESDRHGMRIAIGLKRDQIADVTINQLYKHTNMQTSFGIILLAVVNNRPKLLNLKEILEHFVEHRKDVITKRTLFDLKKAEERAHILEGLKIALDNLDDVVALVRGSKSPEEAKNGLIKRFELSPIQAQAILDMRLQRLTGLERDKINDEYNALLKDIAWYKEILSSDEVVTGIIKQELADLKDEFNDKRRTRLAESAGEINIEDLIAEEDMVVTITRSGYIKRNPVTLYANQHRGGKGKTAMGTKADDFVEHLFVASTHHTFLFITNFGKVYQTKVYELPMAGRSSLGKALVNLLNLSEGEKVATILTVPEFAADQYVMMATKKGRVKKTDLMAYSRPRSGGLIGIKLAEEDELIAARIIDSNMDIFLGSEKGKVIRFHEEDIRATARGSMGVRGMRIDPGSSVVGMEALCHGETLLTVTENGYGKRTSIEEYRAQARGGKGVFSIKTSQRNGMMVSLLLVDDKDELMLVTDKGKLIRISMDGISIISRNTQGVKLINLASEEKLIGIARLPEGEEKEEDAGVQGTESDDKVDVDDVEAGVQSTESDDKVDVDDAEAGVQDTKPDDHGDDHEYGDSEEK
ncbi:MAG: DNA gyrase subunit A [Thermodesulfobacteriota bacterium]|nr:DNA gyrase subunit A [Thermodesulfobacteriota bacterium]